LYSSGENRLLDWEVREVREVRDVRDVREVRDVAGCYREVLDG
jgi:hypothetical protein